MYDSMNKEKIVIYRDTPIHFSGSDILDDLAAQKTADKPSADAANFLKEGDMLIILLPVEYASVSRVKYHFHISRNGPAANPVRIEYGNLLRLLKYGGRIFPDKRKADHIGTGFFFGNQVITDVKTAVCVGDVPEPLVDDFG